MEANINNTTETDQKLEQLKAILYLLQTHLEDLRDEVDRSYALLKIGEFTDLSKKIKNSLLNPLDSIFDASANIDNQVKSIVDKIVKSHIQKHKSIVEKAYKSKTNLNELHYSIVLKEDNIKNRNKIFDFFDKYDLLPTANKYPVLEGVKPKVHIKENKN